MVLGARNAGFTKLIVPARNADEAALVAGIELYAVDSLRAAVAVVAGHGAKWRRRTHGAGTRCGDELAHGDFVDVRGQLAAQTRARDRRGRRPQLAARRAAGLRKDDARAPAAVDSSADVAARSARSDEDLQRRRIARRTRGHRPRAAISLSAPHDQPNGARRRRRARKPGEISLAHHGVLFLDELPEFTRSAIEVMRQPLEDGTVTIARAAGTFTYPARFQLVASMNPCPCGYRGTRSAECRCDDAMVAKYVGKLSGPLLDRIDLQIEIARVPFDEMVRYDGAERSAAIRERVVAARERQHRRFTGSVVSCNAEIPGNAMRRYCALDEAAMRLLAQASAKRQFSARALDRIARVARTIADLAASGAIAAEHVAEAISIAASNG